jgi:hypothetical protein
MTNMFRSMLSYRAKQAIDLILPSSTISIAIFFLIQSIYTITTQSSLFAQQTIPFTSIQISSFTVLNLSLIYIINFNFFRTFLPGHQRTLRAVIFTTIGLLTYNFVTSIYYANLNDFSTLLPSVASLLVILVYSYIINKTTRIFNITPTRVFLLSFFILTTSFLFLTSNPTIVNNIIIETLPTIINKAIILWIWFIIALR